MIQSSTKIIQVSSIQPSGIFRVNSIFAGREESSFGIGIVDAELDLKNVSPDDASCRSQMVIFLSEGYMVHLGRWIVMPNILQGEQNLSLELNLDSPRRTCHVFFNDRQWNQYVLDIPPKIRIFAFLSGDNQSFQIESFQLLRTQKSIPISGSNLWEWGKYWDYLNETEDQKKLRLEKIFNKENIESQTESKKEMEKDPDICEEKNNEQLQQE
ncbi:MAG: hypothetical protein EZS28_007011 [Streblomastix strix]|uniref:Uncharacterized protein n=1 Tax=Streblomastix strix TaxID=222440 RepID=A0A5J4WRB1_9EUKA|nr:MAG: hypothetical protein EZS28_007011 [Streblomastix strix]